MRRNYHCTTRAVLLKHKFSFYFKNIYSKRSQKLLNDSCGVSPSFFMKSCGMVYEPKISIHIVYGSLETIENRSKESIVVI